MKIITLLICAALVIGTAVGAPAFEGRTSGSPAVSTDLQQDNSVNPEDASLRGAVFSSVAAAPRQISLSPVPVSTKTIALDLSISTTFAITRPTATLTTTYKSYFVTGTSDPSRPVYYGDKEIDRTTSNGLFGVLVPLEIGNNTVTFRQGDVTKSVTIKRVSPASADAPITKITQASMVPGVMATVEYGQALGVGCVAPSGATVTATFDGKSVNLSQVATTSSPGIPAVFKGEIPIVKDYEAGTVTKAGKVTYNMSYNGTQSSYTSTGNVYVAGEGNTITVEVSSYVGFVYPDTSNLGVFREYLKKGARDTVKSQDNTYFELSSGGFIPKTMVAVVMGKGGVSNSIASASLSVSGKQEVYTFEGTATPAYFSRVDDSGLKLTLFNSSGTPVVSGQSGSKIFSSSSVSENGRAITYSFSLREGRSVWGYNVSFDGKNTLLTVRYKPSIDASSSTPFTGVTVLLDPGHGGAEGGALGVAGKNGPVEATLNLAHAYAARDKLESMGATVVMTRDDDSLVTLDDRLKMIEDTKCDVFISLHHNSVAESSDANTISGMEVYYHQNLSGKLANTVMNNMSSGLGRTNRKVAQSYYRVTLIPYAPAILVELGYLSNPIEYTKATTQSEIDKAASSLAAGLKASLQ